MNFNIRIQKDHDILVSIEKFEIVPNKINFLFGESGIGKSLISKAIYGVLDNENLDIEINQTSFVEYLKSENLQKIQKNGFFVFQEPSTHLNPLRSISKQLNEGQLKDLREKDEKAILNYLFSGQDKYFINKLLDVFPKPFRPSGGEKQRFLLAMAFKKIKQYLDNRALNQALYIFDEPTGSLDNEYRNRFLDLLFECYKQKPFTILLITHDYSIIHYCETKHRNLQDAFIYKELIRKEKLLQRNFSKKDFLKWLNDLKPFDKKISYQDDPLLRINTGVKVFGNILNFYRADDIKKTTDLAIYSGELVYLKAPSGLGKTTVSKIVMGLIHSQKAQFAFKKMQINSQKPERFWRKHIWGKLATMVFQHADEALNQNTTVQDVFTALSSKKKITRSKIMHSLRELFEDDIDDTFLDKPIKYLSGGQKQRINILRGLVLNTDILILDEPLNGLDLVSASKVIDKIQTRQQEGKAILLISHNEDIFERIVKPENIYYLKKS